MELSPEMNDVPARNQDKRHKKPLNKFKRKISHDSFCSLLVRSFSETTEKKEKQINCEFDLVRFFLLYPENNHYNVCLMGIFSLFVWFVFLPQKYFVIVSTLECATFFNLRSTSQYDTLDHFQHLFVK